MLARLLSRAHHLRPIVQTLAFHQPLLRPPPPPPAAPLNPSFLHHRSLSTRRGGDDGGSWKFTPDADESPSLFGEEDAGLSGISSEPSRPAGPSLKGAAAAAAADLWSQTDPKGDIFENIEQEFGPPKEGEDWETAKGYKPWSLGDDDEKQDVFGIVGEGLEGIGDVGIDEEAEKEAEAQKLQLENRETELQAILKGPERAFGDLIEQSGITEDMICSLILLKDVRGVPGLPPLTEIEDKAIEKLNMTSTRGEIERKKQEEIAQSRVRQVDEKGRAYGTGRRKCSVARVWIQRGDGKFIVNDKPFDSYFPILDQRAQLLHPFVLTNTLGLWDITCTVKGGGVSGQVGAIRLGISRALQNWEPGLRQYLKPAGYMTRDPRAVERKKPGKAKARKSFAWVKR